MMHMGLGFSPPHSAESIKTPLVLALPLKQKAARRVPITNRRVRPELQLR